MRLLYHPRRALLGFETYVAPGDFNRKEQSIDIYEVFCRYYLHHRDARWIYSVTDATATTKPHGGTSYRYGYTSSGVSYAADLADGDTITWVSGSTKRWVIAKHTSTGMMACDCAKHTGNYNAGAEWLYCGDKINAVYTSDSSALTSTVKYIHIHRLLNIDTYGYCCHYYTPLTGILYLSSSATFIDNHSFDGCTSLSCDLVIPDSITIIGATSFARCGASFTSITLSSNLVEIQNNAFWSTTLGGTIPFPESLEKIGSEAFLNSTGLTGILTIPAACLEIGRGAFGHTSFTSIVSESANFEVYDYCLYDITGGGCLALHGQKGYTGTLTLKTGTTKILEFCFSMNARTGSLVILDTITEVEQYGVGECSEMTGTLTLGSALENIAMRAFWRSKFTGTLTIPNSVKYLRYGAFSGFTGFTSLVLGSGLEIIEAPALSGTGFTGTLTIPASVVTLELGSFGPYTNFSSISSSASNYPAEDNVLYDTKTSGQVVAHLNAKAYSGTLTLKSTTTRIYNDCFNGSSRTGACNVPATVTVINDGGLANVSGFTVFNLYPATAPIATTAFSNYNKALHVPASNSGYNVAPWTNTAIFSSITNDL